MKKTNLLYWIFTGLFGAFMLLSGLPNIISSADSVAMVSGELGYPEYIIPFLGVAKLLGVIAIVIPGFPRIKEWAYAGLFFDLLGATYSVIAVNGLRPDMLMMLLPFSLIGISYVYYHKRTSQKHVTQKSVIT